MRTFLQLQNDALKRIGDDEDQDKMRELVRDSINTVHKQVLTERRYQFMLWPRVETLALVANQKNYPLHPQFGQLWYGQHTSTGDWIEEIPAGGIIEMGDNILTGESAAPYRFMLTAVQNVKAQPTTPGTLTVTTTGGNESAANKIYIKGIDASGEYVEETLSDGSAWSALTSSTSWSVIEAISKSGSFTRTISCVIGTTTVLTLLANEYGRQYRQAEFTKSPTTSGTINYRFYKKPLKLVNDYDVPQIPEEYDDILVFGALIDLQGFGRPDPAELREWMSKRDNLIDQMQKQYQQSRSVNGRASMINHTAR